MDLQLKDKVVLITGGTSGIGLAATKRFLEEGAKVMMCALSKERGQEALNGLSHYKDKIDFTSIDVAVVDDCEKAVAQTVKRFGRVDILLNSAGVYRVHDIEDVDEDTYDWMMNTNLKGTFFMCKYAVSQLRKQKSGGAIINISSDAGIMGNDLSTVYCGTKGGVEIMSKALALDVAPEQIRVNCIAPGDINTPMLDKDLAREKDPAAYLKKLVEPYPIGRIGTADEVAVMVLWLASPLSGFTTGSSWSVDGGIAAG
jgi:NAD(P)-dependent dehydrogenase (short-subunit alcohol dehydrogenase family)